MGSRPAQTKIQDPDQEGSLIGRACGRYRDLRDFFRELDCKLDAHLMESLGLFWAAVMVLQLRHVGSECFESDCQSAIDAAKGVCKTRAHPICRVMAALHLCLRIALPLPPRYVHVSGHPGIARNVLANALADYGADGNQMLPPFQLDLGLWF